MLVLMLYPTSMNTVVFYLGSLKFEDLIALYFIHKAN